MAIKENLIASADLNSLIVGLDPLDIGRGQMTPIPEETLGLLDAALALLAPSRCLNVFGLNAILFLFSWN